jgi:hypothetical protein
MLKKFKLLLILKNDKVVRIARDYGCHRRAVERELAGEHVSDALRRFIAKRWRRNYQELWGYPQSVTRKEFKKAA